MTINWVYLKNYPIFEQLQLEEALLRTDHQNWCIVNEGSSQKAIVMGISGKMEQLVDQALLQEKPIPIIRRFTGGGTVIVDDQTLFITFICQGKTFPAPVSPQSIMNWTESLYLPVFEHPQFRMLENDYIIGDHKVGGNAQYIQKDRWLHHTSFLWEYDPGNMDYLLLPTKTPLYRKKRKHSDFLTSLKTFYNSPQQIINRLYEELSMKFGSIQSFSLEQLLLQMPSSIYRKSTAYIYQS
ncbi:MAG: putative lipoate-protein ligase [Chlamydiales bacterium]|jgi:lipoate-protein ligase A|nr:putative lipoate-protein ligase [Chlamydiales bacterium]